MDNTKFKANSPHSAPATPLLTVDFARHQKSQERQVREMFDLDDCFLMVATDRIFCVRLHYAQRHPAPKAKY